MVSALAQAMSTHLHPEAGRGRGGSGGGSFRRRKSRSRSPSVLPGVTGAQRASPGGDQGEAKMVSTVTTTTTTITTTVTSVAGGAPMITTTSGMDGQHHPSYPMEGDEMLRSPMRDGAGAVFADTVTDLVDIVKYETSRKGRARCKLKLKLFWYFLLLIFFHL